MAENNNQLTRHSQRKSRKRRAGNMYLTDISNIQSTPRMKETYSDYLKIKQNLSQRLDPAFGATFSWVSGDLEQKAESKESGGVICCYCDEDQSLSGWFTRGKPIKRFEYYTLVLHLKTPKHYKRCPKEIQEIIDRELKGKKESIVVLTTEADSLFNLFAMLNKYCDFGYSFTNADDLAKFICGTGGNLYIKKYNNWASHREMILSMGYVLKNDTLADVDFMVHNYGLSIVLDSQKIRNKGITIYRGRGFAKNGNIKQVLIIIKNSKKRMNNNLSLIDLTTIDTGKDIFNALDEIVIVDLQSSWDKINGITFDGKSAHFGQNKGAMRHIKDKNGKTRVIWSICHRVSLIIGNALKHVPAVKEHIQQLKALYSFFNGQINDQLFDGISCIEDFENTRIENVIDKAFNNLLKPVGKVQGNYDYILKTLQFLKTNKPNDEVKALWKYWSNVQVLLLNIIILSIVEKCNKCICNIEFDDIDIITIYSAVNQFKLDITRYESNAFDVNDKHMNLFRGKFRFFQNSSGVKKVKHDNFQWTVSRNQCVEYVCSIGKKIHDSMMGIFNQKFDGPELKFFESLKYVFDPASYKIYQNLSEAANHGQTELTYVITCLNNKRDNFGMRVGYNYNYNLIQSEYEMARAILYKFKDFQSDKMRLRIRRITNELWQQKHLLSHLFQLYGPIITLWGDQLNVEKDFGIREWILAKRRLNMDDDLFAAILRIYCERKKESEDAEAYQNFIWRSCVNWHQMKGRNHGIVFIEKLSALKKESIFQHISCLELIKDMQKNGI